MLAISRSFRRRRDLAALARLAASRGIGVWVVGGAARDRLLGRRELDVDIAVSADAEGLARRMEALGLGTAVPVSREGPRVFRVAGRREIDIAELEGSSIARDLARRDFTANAIAVDLSSGAWIDPFGGAEDLARRRLALVGEENLAEDPLRAFRAARLYATHGLAPDRRAERACRAVAPRLSAVAAERIRIELSKMLEARRVSAPFAWAARTGLLAPALRLAVSRRRLRKAAAALARLDASGVGRLPAERRRALRLAVIAWACGLSSRGAARWLSGLRFGRAEASRVATLLALALRASRLDGSGEREAWRWVRDARESSFDALRLVKAQDPRKAPLARRLRRRIRGARRGPRVSGGDLLRWLEIPPGPRVGALLRELEVETLRGTVRTRRQARRFVKGQRDIPFPQEPSKIR